MICSICFKEMFDCGSYKVCQQDEFNFWDQYNFYFLDKDLRIIYHKFEGVISANTISKNILDNLDRILKNKAFI